ncbi:MAG TPA: hypothetical protein VFQ41_12125 [Candidatus Angelobacter sp.]|nr:hypothetical protein [Candidatus Angelobacter sp.]
MEGIGRSIKQLRELALGEPSAFARCLEKLLATDFDTTFYYLKTQKLLFTRRSSTWISNLERELLPWLERAPLKGKQRTQIKRHLIVCKSLQHLFEIVDEESSTLRIWQASTADLLRSLFASAEELRFAQKAHAKKHKSEFRDQLNTMKHLDMIRMEHRIHCDYLTRIVAQIAHLGINSAGEVKPTPSDIKDALTLAAWDDMLLHILDCYTYRSFRVSVEGKHLKMHGVQSQTEASYTWSVLRHSSREVLDNHQILTIVKKVEVLAESFNSEFDCFSSFLESSQGVDLLHASQPVRSEYARILKRDVTELIDLDMTLRTSSGLFRVDELLECWSLLIQLSVCAELWCRIIVKSNIAVLRKTQLVSLIAYSLGCTIEQGERLVSQFSLAPNKPNQDPFFRPLIELNSEERLLAASFIETSRFSRNLFTIAIREGHVNFSAKGLKPLKSLYREFGNAGFKVAINFPITVSGKTITDIDIAATKDGFLFIGQTKVLIHPDTLYDDWKVLENLKRAAEQLKTTLQHVPMMSDRFRLTEGEFLVVPFLLTNVWGLTGTTIAGFKVIDFSYLSNLLRGGEIWKVQFEPEPTREIIKMIKGRYPTGEELSRLVLKSIHEEMFEKAQLEDSSFAVGDWTVTIPVDRAKSPRNDAVGKPTAKPTRRNPSFASILKG